MAEVKQKVIDKFSGNEENIGLVLDDTSNCVTKVNLIVECEATPNDNSKYKSSAITYWNNVISLNRVEGITPDTAVIVNGTHSQTVSSLFLRVLHTEESHNHDHLRNVIGPGVSSGFEKIIKDRCPSVQVIILPVEIKTNILDFNRI